MKYEFEDGSVINYYPDFLTQDQAQILFNQLLNIDWEQKYYKNFKTQEMMPQPRLTAWYADNPNMEYAYSGVKQVVKSWTPELLEIKSNIESFTNSTYNSVLINYYRNEKDSVGFHADDEKNICENSNIASLSLGALRNFILQKNDKTNNLSFNLENGSLLIMGGTTQRYWRHSIPKEKNKTEPRINLTFRKFTL